MARKMEVDSHGPWGFISVSSTQRAAAGQQSFRRQPGMRAAGTREERESVERFEGYIWLVSATHIRQPAGKAGEKGREST
jgi:hypothetical protein